MRQKNNLPDIQKDSDLRRESLRSNANATKNGFNRK